MSNPITNKYYDYFYTILDEDKLQHIRKDYTVIDVDGLDKFQVNLKMNNTEYFERSPEKKEIVNNMLEYYLNDKDKNIYKKTEYLCNEKEQIFICNNHAETFRKIYDGINYRPKQKYISWSKKNEQF